MRRTSLASLLALSLAACGGDPVVDTDGGSLPDSGDVVDGGPLEDGGADVDGGSVGDGGADVDGGGTPGECGGARPDVSGITGTEGLVIARDGTLYYSQSGGVGRMTPDGTQDDGWLSISGTSTIWGLALDAPNERLYVASPSMTPASGRIYMVDLTAATPTATEFLTGAGQPNGMTIGPDGALYYSDFGGDAVYRVPTGAATGTRAEVTASAIASANGVAFLTDGTLLVASYSGGTIQRLTLTAGVETARAQFAGALGSPDGIAVDADGRVYVTNQAGRRVIRLEPDGSVPTPIVMSINGPASLEFGTGALDCEDLYITSSGSMQRYQDGNAAGAAVPWH